MEEPELAAEVREIWCFSAVSIFSVSVIVCAVGLQGGINVVISQQNVQVRLTLNVHPTCMSRNVTYMQR